MASPKITVFTLIFLLTSFVATQIVNSDNSDLNSEALMNS